MSGLAAGDVLTLIGFMSVIGAASRHAALAFGVVLMVIGIVVRSTIGAP